MTHFPRIAAAVAAAVIVAGSAPAFAGTFESNGRTAEVRFGDLNLAKPEHQKELRARISKAAISVCTDKNLTLQMECAARARAQVREPVKVAIARAQSNERYAAAGETKVVVGN